MGPWASTWNLESLETSLTKISKESYATSINASRALVLGCLLQLLLRTCLNSGALWIWNRGPDRWEWVPYFRCPGEGPRGTHLIQCFVCTLPHLPSHDTHLMRHTSPAYSCPVTLSLPMVTCSHTPLTRHIYTVHTFISCPHYHTLWTPDRCTHPLFHPCIHIHSPRDEATQGHCEALRQSPARVGKRIAKACFRKCHGFGAILQGHRVLQCSRNFTQNPTLLLKNPSIAVPPFSGHLMGRKFKILGRKWKKGILQLLWSHHLLKGACFVFPVTDLVLWRGAWGEPCGGVFGSSVISWLYQW